MKWLFFILALLLFSQASKAADPVNNCHNNTGGGTATSITCSITPAATGHFFIATYSTFGPSASPGIVISNTAGSTWNSLGDFATGSPGHIITIRCAQVNSVSAQTFTGTDSEAATSHAIDVVEYANITSCTSSGTPAGSAGNTSGPTSVSAGNITTSVATRLVSVIFTCAASDTSVNSAGSGYTKQVPNQFNATGIGGCLGNLELEDQFASSSGTFAGAWTVNVSTGSTFSCAGSTNRACWDAAVAAFPSTADSSGTKPHAEVMGYHGNAIYKKIPWDNRKRKLQIERI